MFTDETCILQKHFFNAQQNGSNYVVVQAVQSCHIPDI